VTAAPINTEDQNGWTKLRRRKVVQWGLIYVAGAWGFLQGLEYVSESFHWPEQLRQIALLALVIGLPIALVLAWYHGDRGQQRITTPEFAILTLLLLPGGGVFWYYQRASEAARFETTQSELAARPDTSSEMNDARPSIAVLPFDNRSREADDIFFVDGIHDDILTQLTKVGALKVIARGSVEQFRDTKLTTKEIGEKLGVSKVLEGGVQRAGDRVRVTVQLIDAATDAHVWAESYDRELSATNIFAIQSEVAAAIAGALKATLTAGERARVDAIPTQSLSAWEAYQLGKQRMVPRTSAYLIEAEQFFQTAIEHDPRFALAYVGLADARLLQIAYAGAPREVTHAQSKEAVERALELDPNSGEAWTTAAALAGHTFEYDRAEQMFRRAIELNPNYATAYHWFAVMLRDRGRPRDALSQAEIAVDLDPLSPRTIGIRAQILDSLGRPGEALSAYAKAIQIDPMSPLAYQFTGVVLAGAFGLLDRAIPWMEKAVSLDGANPYILAITVRYYRQLGKDAEASRWLERALERAGKSWQVNELAAEEAFLRGDREAGRTYARRAEAANAHRVRLLRDDDLRRGDYATARTRYSKAHPELFGKNPPEVTAFNLADAIDLALVMQHTGEPDRATVLLERADEVIRRYPRRSFKGGGVGWFMFEEVSLHALRGDKAGALARLRAMRYGGWWNWTHAYHRDLNPNLASIRAEPEFKAVFADIERDMAQQRARLAARSKDAPLDLATSVAE
jgi:TolB-like protein/Tfp pilus assembly protein PilF